MFAVVELLSSDTILFEVRVSWDLVPVDRVTQQMITRNSTIDCTPQKMKTGVEKLMIKKLPQPHLLYQMVGLFALLVRVAHVYISGVLVLQYYTEKGVNRNFIQIQYLNTVYYCCFFSVLVD